MLLGSRGQLHLKSADHHHCFHACSYSQLRNPHSRLQALIDRVPTQATLLQLLVLFDSSDFGLCSVRCFQAWDYCSAEISHGE